jgi:insertion element IS1 protein InsB
LTTFEAVQLRYQVDNTLRQRLARFVRMTLSFSKSVVMHEACLLLFLHRSNRERAILLK